MARTIFLPTELSTKLDALTELKQETCGILLYRPTNNLCPLESMFITGVGTEGHVQSSEDRVKISNAFFEHNPDYRFVKFHTHSRGTIEKYGSYFATHFSQEDIDGIKQQLKLDKDYISLLATPKTKIVCGMDNPQLQIGDPLNRYKNRNEPLGRAFEIVARNLGYTLANLSATKKK